MIKFLQKQLSALLLLFCLLVPACLLAQQPANADSLFDNFRAIRVLPLYLFAIDAQQIRVGYEVGNDLASWQAEVGLVVPLLEVSFDGEQARNQYGFTSQLARRWGLGKTSYLSGSAEYRLITYHVEEYAPQYDNNGEFKYMQYEDYQQYVHSPTLHLMLGKRFKRPTGKTIVDLETGFGYKWAYKATIDGSDFFVLDMSNDDVSHWQRKFNLRLNLVVGFILKDKVGR